MNAAELAQQEGVKNRLAVWKFFRENPCHTKGDCASALGLTPHTVGAHCRAIRDGWRPEPTADLEAQNG